MKFLRSLRSTRKAGASIASKHLHSDAVGRPVGASGKASVAGRMGEIAAAALRTLGFNVNLGAPHNPFFNGANADMLSLIPFVVLMILLYLAGRKVILAGKDAGKKAAGT